MAAGQQISQCSTSIIHRAGPICNLWEPKKPSSKVENNSFDSLKSNSACKEGGKQAVPPHQEVVKNKGGPVCTLSMFSAIHSCTYTLSMPYHRCSGLCPSHSCSKLLIFTERGRRPPDSNHQRFCPGNSSFLSLLTLSQKVAIIASL